MVSCGSVVVQELLDEWQSRSQDSERHSLSTLGSGASEPESIDAPRGGWKLDFPMDFLVFFEVFFGAFHVGFGWVFAGL